MNKNNKNKDPSYNITIETRAQLLRAEQRISELEGDIDLAESNAANKDEELANVIFQLRKYEKGKYKYNLHLLKHTMKFVSGEFGLEDVLRDLNLRKEEIKRKDKEIHELKMELNQAQFPRETDYSEKAIPSEPKPILKDTNEKALVQVKQQ